MISIPVPQHYYQTRTRWKIFINTLAWGCSGLARTLSLRVYVGLG